MKKLFCIAIVLLCSGCAPEIMPRPAPDETHVHKWGKWDKAELTSRWNAGTQLWQTRQCDVCGWAEMRVTQVSPGEKK